MKALLCRQFGPPESLVIENLPSPRPGAGEVVVSIKAAAVNFPDGLIIQNRHQIKAVPPFIPGYELAGVVKELGSGVTGLRLGDCGVAQVKWGGFAEEIALRAERFWPVPAGLDSVRAAAFPLAYGTSYYALKDRARLKTGETLLVLGAAGGVGIAAVQFGKLLGARVIAAASTALKLETARLLGADAVVDYTREHWREEVMRMTAGQGVDVVMDPVGGRYAEPAVRCMAAGGRYLIVGFTAGDIPRIPLNLPLLKQCELMGVLWDTYSHREPQAARRNIRDMADMIVSGKLQPLVSATYPLEQAARALTEVLERRVTGKVVIVM